MKKSIHVLTALLVVLAMFFSACEGPVGPGGKDGTDGSGTDGTDGIGDPGSIYLSGPVTTAGIQAAVNSAAPLVFAGVTQSDPALITIPVDRKITLVGEPALTVNAGGGVLLLEGDNAFLEDSTGTVAAGTSAVILNKGSAFTKGAAGAQVVPLTLASAINGTLPGGAVVSSTVAISGDINVKTSGAAAGEISLSELSGKTVYLWGTLTVTNGVTATAFRVDGDVAAASTITANITATGSVTATSTAAITGNVSAASFSSAVTGSDAVSGTLTTTGNATFSGVDASTGGIITVGGNLIATGATTGFTTGDALIVTGTSTFGGPVDFNAGNATFTGGVTFKAGEAITIATGNTLTPTGADLTLPAGTTTVQSTSLLNIGSGALTLTEVTALDTAASAVVVATNVGQIEALLPKAGTAFSVRLATTGSLSANATVKKGTVLDIPITVNLVVGSFTLTLEASNTSPAKLTGAGSLVAGNTSIVPNAGLTAVDGGGTTTIVIGADSVTSTANTTVLTFGTNTAATVAASGNLVVTSAAINTFTGTGAITLTQGATAAKITFVGGAAPAKLITGDTTGTLGSGGNITATGAATFIATGSAVTFLDVRADSALQAIGFTSIATTAAVFKTLVAGIASQDVILQAGTTQDGTVSKTTELGSNT
jgi:hypothetical protein